MYKTNHLNLPMKPRLPSGAVSLTGLAFEPLGQLGYLEYTRMADLDEGQTLLLRPPLYRGPVNAKFLAQRFRAYIFAACDLNDVDHSCFLQNCVLYIVYRPNCEFHCIFIVEYCEPATFTPVCAFAESSSLVNAK
jgi:hypothetical protein